MGYQTLDLSFGRDSRDRREDALDPGFQGAVASLETFYYSFNTRNPVVLAGVWAEDPLIQLNNPLGGILRGQVAITGLYDRVLRGPATVWVEFHDIVAYGGDEWTVFAGRERGAYRLDGAAVELMIRTTRVFVFCGADLGWRQIHHHGSIDNPDMLHRYQDAVQGAAASRTTRATTPFVLPPNRSAPHGHA